MARLLQNVIGGLESSAKVRESLAMAYWPRVVGAQAAAATEPDTVRDGVLFVRTKSSVWSHELSLHKTRLLQSLNKLLGGRVITEIVFRAQGVRKKETVVEPELPSPEEMAAVVLEPFEKDELRARLQDLHSLEDERIRNTIATRIMQEAKVRHWRLERGWRVCARCTALHKTDYEVCPICRLC